MFKLETPAQLSSKVLPARKALLFLMAPSCPRSVFVRERLEMIQARNSSLIIAAADATQVPELATTLKVTVFPTIVLFQSGKVISRLEGIVGGREIQLMVDSVFW